MADFISDITKSTKNEYAGVASKGIISGDIQGFTDTGSFYFNSLISASIFKGLPNGKVTALAGPSGTGKTYILLSIIKSFLEKNKDGIVMLFESESALTKQMLEERGIDISRIIIVPIVTVQEFRNQVISVIDKYLSMKKTEQRPFLMGLDSLGMLSTTKEMEDAASGSDKKDMTRAQVIRSVFRVITLKLGRANIPMVITNHIYSTLSAYSANKMSGGDGLVYAASTIIYLSKSKEKDEQKHVIGSVLRCRVEKGRLTKEQSEAFVYINFATGMQKYFGLVQVALDAGIWEKMSAGFVRVSTKTPSIDELKSKKSEFITEDTYKRIHKTIGIPTIGSLVELWELNENGKMIGEDGKVIAISGVRKEPEKWFTEKVWDKILNDDSIVEILNKDNIFSIETKAKEIATDPEYYFTEDVLEKIDDFLYKKFSYGAVLDDKIKEENLNE